MSLFDVVKRIDEFAREKQRDVLWVVFYDPSKKIPSRRNPKDSKRRERFIAFLEQHQIPWSPCFEPWGPSWEVIPYYGSIYLDVPYDVNLPQYQLLANYLENPDGSPRYSNACFAVRTLEMANQWTLPQAESNDI
jgi:hypothetical protein